MLAIVFDRVVVLEVLHDLLVLYGAVFVGGLVMPAYFFEGVHHFVPALFEQVQVAEVSLALLLYNGAFDVVIDLLLCYVLCVYTYSRFFGVILMPGVADRGQDVIMHSDVVLHFYIGLLESIETDNLAHRIFAFESGLDESRYNVFLWFFVIDFAQEYWTWLLFARVLFEWVWGLFQFGHPYGELCIESVPAAHREGEIIEVFDVFFYFVHAFGDMGDVNQPMFRSVGRVGSLVGLYLIGLIELL